MHFSIDRCLKNIPYLIIIYLSVNNILRIVFFLHLIRDPVLKFIVYRVL